MSSRIGRMLSVQIFGESHGPAVGVTLDGLPAGLALDMDALSAFLQRRAARGSAIATPRRESDLPRIMSGLKDGATTGQPLTALFDNADTHSADYGFLPDRPRPGHADYPAWVRSAGFDDLRGSGHHSGRLTLPYAFAGGVALQLLSREGVCVGAHVLSISSERDDALDPLCPDMEALARCHAQPVPTLDPEAGSRMYAAIMEARAAGDSLGGVVECAAVGLPAGLGEEGFVIRTVGRHGRPAVFHPCGQGRRIRRGLWRGRPARQRVQRPLCDVGWAGGHRAQQRGRPAGRH